MLKQSASAPGRSSAHHAYRRASSTWLIDRSNTTVSIRPSFLWTRHRFCLVNYMSQKLEDFFLLVNILCCLLRVGRWSEAIIDRQYFVSYFNDAFTAKIERELLLQRVTLFRYYLDPHSVKHWSWSWQTAMVFSYFFPHLHFNFLIWLQTANHSVVNSLTCNIVASLPSWWYSLSLSLHYSYFIC